MGAISSIQPNSTITGPALSEPVEVHAVMAMGTSARIMGVGRRTGSPYNAILTADQLAAQAKAKLDEARVQLRELRLAEENIEAP